MSVFALTAVGAVTISLVVENAVVELQALRWRHMGGG